MKVPLFRVVTPPFPNILHSCNSPSEKTNDKMYHLILLFSGLASSIVQHSITRDHFFRKMAELQSSGENTHFVGSDNGCDWLLLSDTREQVYPLKTGAETVTET
jgi:hypothetical protein